MERFDIEQVIRILGLSIHSEQADGGRDFDVACRIAENALRKYKNYRDLEEQGLLLKLPCKVRDEFWVIAYSNRKITHVKCTGYCIQKDTSNQIDDSYVWIDSMENPGDYWKLSFNDFKIQCFPTQAEAEEALKRMEREEK